MKKVLFGRKGYLTFYLLITILLSVLMVANALVIQRISSVQQKSELPFIFLGTLIFLVLQSLSYFFQQYYADKIAKIITNDLRVLIFKELRETPGFKFFSVGKDRYLARLTSQLNIVEQSFLTKLFWGIYLICQFIVALVLALRMNWIMSLAVLGLTIPQIIIPLLSRKKIIAQKRKVSQQTDNFLIHANDFLAGSTTWRSFHKEQTFFNRVTQQAQQLKNAEITDAKILNLIDALNKFFADTLYFGTWLIGAYFIITRQIELSMLVGFAQIISSISFPLNSATEVISQIMGGLEVVKTILPTKDETTDFSAFSSNNIELKQVTYSVEEKTILQEFTHTFEKGKRYLLIGASGSGKSTLFKLIFNELKPTSGMIARFSNIAYVPQETHIFNGTLLENVSLFAPDPNMKQYQQIVTQLGLISKESQLLTNETVSGGEKSRIALARAMYSKAEFLVIDELSSALDKKTQFHIEQTLLNSNLSFIYASHKYDDQFIAQFDEVIEMTNITKD